MILVLAFSLVSLPTLLKYGAIVTYLRGFVSQAERHLCLANCQSGSPIVNYPIQEDEWTGLL
jgi:hypothetical protein